MKYSTVSYRNWIILIFFTFCMLSVIISFAADYFPLHIGNTWQYKYADMDSLFYLPDEIYDTIRVANTIYYTFGSNAEYPFLLRADSLGRIYQRIDARDIIWFDFTSADSSHYQYQPFLNESILDVFVRRNITTYTFAGKFKDCIEFYFCDTTRTNTDILYTFAPEVGIVRKQFSYEEFLLASAFINGQFITTVQEINIKTPWHNILSQNYPNPFNASTLITYHLPNAAPVAVEIFDVLGRKVKTLVHSTQDAGEHSILWNGKDNLNQTVPSGIYFYKLKTNGTTSIKKMILLL